MKMPEKHDLLGRHILAAKEQGTGQSLRLQWRTFAGGDRYGGAFTKTVIDATMCAIIA